MRYSRSFSIIILVLLLFLCLPALANTPNQDKLDLDNLPEEQQFAKNINNSSLLLRYIVSVLGVVVLTYFAVKYFARKFESQIPAKDWIEVLDQMPLGNAKGIYLVEIEGKGYVLGVTDQQINVITTLENEIPFNKLRNKQSFSKTLQRHLMKTQNLYLGKEGNKENEN